MKKDTKEFLGIVIGILIIGIVVFFLIQWKFRHDIKATEEFYRNLPVRIDVTETHTITEEYLIQVYLPGITIKVPGDALDTMTEEELIKYATFLRIIEQFQYQEIDCYTEETIARLAQILIPQYIITVCEPYADGTWLCGPYIKKEKEDES